MPILWVSRELERSQQHTDVIFDRRAIDVLNDGTLPFSWLVQEPMYLNILRSQSRRHPGSGSGGLRSNTHALSSSNYDNTRSGEQFLLPFRRTS
jgi:hypothetical protein